MFLSLIIRLILKCQYRDDLYTFRKRYLLACIILALVFVIAGIVDYFTRDDGAYIYLFGYAGLEVASALINYCRIVKMEKTRDHAGANGSGNRLREGNQIGS